MSKTSQRRKSAYDEGYRHAQEEVPQRYSRHPYLKEYRAGYLHGKVKKEKGLPTYYPAWLEKWRRFFRRLGL